jgi:flagellar hook protein FlgE
MNLTYTNGAEAQQVVVNYNSLTQYANSTTINAEADGYASGTLDTVSIDESGTVVGTYTNGVLRKEAQIAVAQFTNAPGLTKKGNSLYIESNNSGTPNIGTADAFGAKITASALEMSNVDVAEEFSNMIITQRGFQSNSKIITVSDEMLENLINMKR